MEDMLDSDLSRAAFARLIDDLTRSGTEMHSFVMYEGGRLVARWGVSPYRADDQAELYSLSKSFTSTAMGVAFDRGLVHEDDLVLSYFPACRGLCESDERWSRLRLRHLMSMSTGHAACVMPRMAFAPDSVRAFFESPLSFEPGEKFVYNTGATCLMAAIVREVTGMTVPEVLGREVFPALDIGAFAWKRCLDGSCQGGTGLALSCEEVAKLGLLYLGEGVYRGTRVLSREWTRLATGKRIDNAGNGTPDWTHGYGYQFWRNAGEGYRGDGAFGQVCAVLPESGVVAAMLAESTDMQKELDALWQFIRERHGTALPSQEPRHAYLPAAALSGQDADSLWRELEDNPAHLRAARLIVKDGTARALLMGEDGVQCVTASGAWQDGALELADMAPALVAMMPRRERQTMRFSAAARSEGEDTVLDIRMRSAPHHFGMRFAFPDGRMRLTMETPLDVFGEEKVLREKA